MCINSCIRCHLFHFIILISLALNTHSYALFDMEGLRQDFVLETKQIDIPNYPDAFNPSIVRWKESILMCFRIRDPITSLTNQIGLIWLDDDCNIASMPKILKMPPHQDIYFPRTQDPRLVAIGSDLFIVYNEFHKTSLGSNRRMAYSKICESNNFFYTEPPTYLLAFENENPSKQEKNWVPFNYNNELHFSYSIEPHLVFRPIAGTHSCHSAASTSSYLKWNWGILRGGTPAEKIDDQYLAFFHSVKDFVSLQSKGSRILHYFMGAYTFNASPPFKVTKISPEPIVGENFYNGPLYDTWKPLLVVFPGGYVHDENYIWIAYGRQDHEVWIVKLDKQGLFDSLVNVSEAP